MRPDPIPAIKEQIGAELARVLDGWRAADIAERLGVLLERRGPASP